MTILKEPALESFFKSGAQSLKAVLFYGQDEGLIEEPETIEIDAEAVTDADEEADKARKE